MGGDAKKGKGRRGAAIAAFTEGGNSRGLTKNPQQKPKTHPHKKKNKKKKTENQPQKKKKKKTGGRRGCWPRRRGEGE